MDIDIEIYLKKLKDFFNNDEDGFRKLLGKINKGKIRKNSSKRVRRGGDDDDVIERGKKFLKRTLIFLVAARAIVSVSFVKIK